MNAHTFLKSHDRAYVERVAKAAGTNMAYFSQIAHGHRKPGPQLARRLVKESGGRMSLPELRPDIYAPQDEVA